MTLDVLTIERPCPVIFAPAGNSMKLNLLNYITCKY